MEELQASETQNFHSLWLAKIDAYKLEANNLVDGIIEKHENESKELEEEIKSATALRVKVNPQRLTLQKIIDTLVKKKEFERLSISRHYIMN